MGSTFELAQRVSFCRDFEGSYEVIVDLQALFDPWESHAKMTTQELRGTLNYGCHASWQKLILMTPARNTLVIYM